MTSLSNYIKEKPETSRDKEKERNQYRYVQYFHIYIKRYAKIMWYVQQYAITKLRIETFAWWIIYQYQ